jgi:MFS family permease
VSALVFGANWQVVGFKPMFVVGSLLYLPLMWIAGKLEEGPITMQSERKPVSHLFRDRGILLLLIATFLSGVANSLSMTFGGIYARFLGGGDLLIGMMIAGGALADLPMMFFSDRISQHLRKPNTVIITYGLIILAYLGYILVPTADALPLFSILKGLGYGLWFTVTVRHVTERTPQEWASTAQSLLGVAMFGFAPLVAGPLGGWIHDTISPAALFGLAISTWDWLPWCYGWLLLGKNYHKQTCLSGRRIAQKLGIYNYSPVLSLICRRYARTYRQAPPGTRPP